MSIDYPQLVWDEATAHACRSLVRLAISEDLERQQDWTTLSLVPAGAIGAADVVARQSGVLGGIETGVIVAQEYDPNLVFTQHMTDGQSLTRGDVVATLSGPARSLLTAERVLLNMLSRLSGVASLTRQYVTAVAGTSARIYDTRKTTPGWRRLEKLAVRAGGGFNHRLNLAAAVLIKDNHLALGAAAGEAAFNPASAIEHARSFLAEVPENPPGGNWIVEVEVDNLDQLAQVLPSGPDIVLLDNMNCDTLQQAIQIRNRLAPTIPLEASGGVNLSTVRGIAETGVERISVGALTHNAVWLDLGLDWK